MIMNLFLQLQKEKKLKYFGHIYRRDYLAKTILQGIVDDNRERGSQ